MAQSENMATIMAKVRAHIMTGKSASTPPTKAKPKVQPSTSAPVSSKSPKASSFTFPDDDEPR